MGCSRQHSFADQTDLFSLFEIFFLTMKQTLFSFLDIVLYVFLFICVATHIQATSTLNMWKFGLNGTLKEVLYHNESRMLLVMRTELNHDGVVCLSDICFVNPLSCSILSSFELNGEGRNMKLVKFEGACGWI